MEWAVYLEKLAGLWEQKHKNEILDQQEESGDTRRRWPGHANWCFWSLSFA